MKTIEKNSKYIKVEVTSWEIETKGFDKVWDEIRYVYSKDDGFDLIATNKSNDGKLIIFTLKINDKKRLKA